VGKDGQPMSLQKVITENLSATRERRVNNSEMGSYDFKTCPTQLHSSVAPIVPQLDIDIDPELDLMLAELENDDDFSKLGENEQKAWLESLFFQDTMNAPGRMPRDQLAKTKTQKKNTLRVNQDSATRLNPVEQRNRTSGGGGRVEDPEVGSTVHVNDKLRNVAQDFFNTNTTSLPLSSTGERQTRKSASPPDSLPSPAFSRKSSQSFVTPPSSRKSSNTDRSSTIDESMGEISGVKQNLCSLAQSYFQAPSGSKSTKTDPEEKKETWEEERKRRDAEEKVREEEAAKEEAQKASLVASFFAGGPPKPTNKPKVQPVQVTQPAREPIRVKERASYEPEGAMEVEDEDDEIERLIRDAKKERASGILDCQVPPPPPRSSDNKALAMMKRLENINNIMQGK